MFDSKHKRSGKTCSGCQDDCRGSQTSNLKVTLTFKIKLIMIKQKFVLLMVVRDRVMFTDQYGVPKEPLFKRGGSSYSLKSCLNSKIHYKRSFRK